MSINPYVLPEEYKKLAIANNLNLVTVYKRIQRGWDIERACTEPSRKPLPHVLKNNRVRGMIQPTLRPRGKKRHYSYYKDDEERFEKAVEQSGITVSEFTCTAIEYYLDKVYEKESRRSQRKNTPTSSNNRKT